MKDCWRRAVPRVAISCAALASLGCDAQPSPVAPGPPRVQFVRTHVDLGQVVVSDEGLVASFPFVNRGQQPLKIQPLETLCDCAGASVSSSVVEAGDAGEVLLMITPRNAEERSTGVSFVCNDPVRSRTELSANWRAVAALKTDPLQLDFGPAVPGSSAVRRLRIVRRDDSPQASQVAAVRCHPKASLAATKLAADEGTPEVVEVVLTAGREWGAANGVVWIDIAGGTSTSIKVPVTWTVTGTVSIVPRSLFVGAGAAGEDFHTVFSVLHANGHEVAISEITSDPAIPGMDWKTARDRPGELTVELAGRFPEHRGIVSGEILISLASPEQCQERVPWSGIVRPQEALP